MKTDIELRIDAAGLPPMDAVRELLIANIERNFSKRFKKLKDQRCYACRQFIPAGKTHSCKARNFILIQSSPSFSTNMRIWLLQRWGGEVEGEGEMLMGEMGMSSFYVMGKNESE